MRSASPAWAASTARCTTPRDNIRADGGRDPAHVHDRHRQLPMKRSTDAILTTHTGSLPRPDDLVELLYAQESDELTRQQRVRLAVAECVREQVDAGIDVVNDG